jgi:hypothetical protein
MPERFPELYYIVEHVACKLITPETVNVRCGEGKTPMQLFFDILENSPVNMIVVHQLVKIFNYMLSCNVSFEGIEYPVHTLLRSGCFLLFEAYFGKYPNVPLDTIDDKGNTPLGVCLHDQSWKMFIPMVLTKMLSQSIKYSLFQGHERDVQKAIYNPKKPAIIDLEATNQNIILRINDIRLIIQ